MSFSARAAIIAAVTLAFAAGIGATAPGVAREAEKAPLAELNDSELQQVPTMAEALAVLEADMPADSSETGSIDDGAGTEYATLAAAVAAQPLEVDDAELNCFDNVHVDAAGRAKVNSYDHVVGIARGNARGSVRGSSQWTVVGNAYFDSYDNATVFGAGAANLRAYGRSRIRARGNCKATLCDTTQGWFVENTEVEVAGGAICYAQNQVRVVKKSPNSRVNRFPSEQRLEVFAWAYHTDRDGASLCVQL